MNNRSLIGGLIGGVVFFILGFLVYGMALRGMMAENMMAGLGRNEDEMQWLFLILGNLFFGFFIAYILDKANAVSFTSGATISAVAGFLISLGMNLTSYATSHMYTTMTGVFVDVIAVTFMCAIVGGVIGAYYGRGRKVVVA